MAELDDTEHKQWVAQQRVRQIAGASLTSFVATFGKTESADHYLDKELCKHASFAMDQKLEQKRDVGRGGWWNTDECTINDLRALLREHIEKADMVDVMNLAAMIYARECMAQVDT